MLTKSFKELVQRHAAEDPAYAEALRREGIDPMLAGDGDAGTRAVNITVLAVTPARAGRLFALASVEIDIGGVVIELHGIRALRVGTDGTRIELPQFRDAAGLPRPVVTLPPEIYQPIGDAVLSALVERGLAKRRFAAA